jgi:hypothetical protein
MIAGVVYQFPSHQPSKEASRTFSTFSTSRMTRKVRERSRRRRFWKHYVIRANIKAELGGRRITEVDYEKPKEADQSSKHARK